MEIAGPIKPRLIVKARYVDDQRIAFPMADRPTHPCIIGTFQLAIHVDVSSGARELIGHKDVLRSLSYLKWVRHIRGARHTRHITLDFGVRRQPMLSVFF